jgi:NADH-quinone oxidoreductase subunit M
MPALAGIFLFVAFSSMGLPGLNGFVGEFLILLGTFIANKAFAVIAVTAVVLGAIYLLWAYQRAMHGTVHEEHRRLSDLSVREYAILAPILAAILVIGIYPKPFLSKIEPAASNVCSQVQTVRFEGRQDPSLRISDMTAIRIAELCAAHDSPSLARSP